MPALSSNYITLADVTKRQNPDKSMAAIVEMLAQMSPVARAGYAVQCNQKTRHRTTLRASIPSPTWVQFYDRITPTKSTTRQVEDTTGMLENMTFIDERLYDITPDKAQLRLSESLAVLEGFAQTVETAFFYGNTATAPLQFLGMAPRFGTISGAENANQIVDGGGTGSTNTSIFGITWGPNTAHLLYPEGIAGGVQREDMGRQKDQNSSGTLWGYEEKFRQHIGFAMVDWRYHFRIANIDVNKLTSASAADLVDLLITAMYRLPSRRGTTGFSSEGAPVSMSPTIYVNARIKEALHKQLLRQPNGSLSKGEFFGEEVMTVMGMPILESDAIVNTETRVT